MLKEVEQFEHLLTRYFELDDLQATRIVIAAAVSHKTVWNEMLWLRIIGASGSGKTELLRTLLKIPYAVPMETITAGAIRRGWIDPKKKKEDQEMLLERLNGKLAITKEFASMLTKDLNAQKEIFGLLRSVYDGSLDADYGSAQGHLHQASSFDWILGSTPYIDKVRNIEYLLGSRFIDLHWESPTDRLAAVGKARDNDGMLDIIRGQLEDSMGAIVEASKEVPMPPFGYIDALADIVAVLRSPVERDRRTREIEDLPSIELGTRMGQALSRIAKGLLMIGVAEGDIKPYVIRLVFNSMARIRAAVIKAWVSGVDKQKEIAARLGVSEGTVSRVIEDIRVLGWKDEWLDILISPDTTNYRLEQAKAEFPKVLKEHPGLITTVVDPRNEAPGGMPAIDKRLFDGFLSTFGKLPDDEQSKVLAWVLEMAQVGIKQRKASQ